MDPTESSIIARNLTKFYGRAAAIQNLSFAIRPGEVVGFLGPNGAGKSTTLRILTGLLPASSGEAWVAGIPVAQYPSSVKKHLGYMPENNPLPEDMRVSEYLHLRAKLKGMGGRKLRQRLGEVLEICDLHRKARRKVIGSLSKGFRQRVGIADAILANPAITILDEPTIGLDPHQVLLIRDLIQHLRGNTTVILSSHILSEVEVLCDRVLILNQGRLVASGTPADLRREFVPGNRYAIETSGTRHTLEAHLGQIHPSLHLIQWNAADTVTPHARAEIESSEPGDLSAHILHKLQQIPDFELYGFRRLQPSLEDIFLIATRRSWETSTDEMLQESSAESPHQN